MAKAIYNKKIITAIGLALYSRVLALEGTARSSKTMLLGDALYYAVAANSEKYHLIAARDLDAIKTNILESEVGLLTLHPDCKLKKSAIGTSYVELIGLDNKPKQIRLANYSNASTWMKILGGTLGVIFIDEVNIASKQFVEECFARQISASDPHTFMTLNGDDPNHWCYSDYINYCNMHGKIPASIVRDMAQFQERHGTKPNWNYMHFTMSDNPVMTPEKIEAAMGIYPKGSYYYQTKILGERGIQGDLLFRDYMSSELIVDAFGKDELGRNRFFFTNYSIGADIGANRAFNSIHLVGYEKGFKRAVVLFEKVFQATGYDKKKPVLFQFLDFCINKLGIRPSQIDGLLLDCAEQNFIADLYDEVYKLFGIDVVGSYKATIKDRIDLMCIGFSLKRILFNLNCRETYNAYLSAQRGKESGTRLDTDETNATGNNDRMDSCEYALTRHMKDLMRNGGDY